MPFTLAHPAAVVPLARRRIGLDLPALVIGSMAPDVIYYLPGVHARSFTHTLFGASVTSLIAGLAGLWVFYVLLFEPLLALLPCSAQQRVPLAARRYTFGPPQRLAWIVLSLVIGAWTHLAWDSFTHDDAWGVLRFPWLSTRVGALGYALPLFRLLQHVSSVVGMAVLAWWAWRWYALMPARSDAPLLWNGRSRYAVLIGIGVGALLGAALLALHQTRWLPGLWRLRVFVRLAAVYSVSMLGAEVLALGVLWRAHVWLRNGRGG